METGHYRAQRPRWSEKEKQRLITLHRQGYSMREIADAMDRPRNGIIGMLHRLRHKEEREEVDEYTVHSRHHVNKPIRIRFKRHAIPKRADPLVKRLFQIMNTEQCSIEQLCKHVGISRTTIQNWKWKHAASYAMLTACFNYLGYEVRVVKIKEEDG